VELVTVVFIKSLVEFQCAVVVIASKLQDMESLWFSVEVAQSPPQ
jgi:hypothetical protein